MEEHKNFERDRRAAERQKIDKEYLDLMQDVTTSDVAGFDGYLRQVTSLVEGQRNFNAIKHIVRSHVW